MRNALFLGVVLALFTGSAMASGTIQFSSMEEGRYHEIKHPLGGNKSITQNVDPHRIQTGLAIAVAVRSERPTRVTGASTTWTVTTISPARSA